MKNSSWLVTSVDTSTKRFVDWCSNKWDGTNTHTCAADHPNHTHRDQLEGSVVGSVKSGKIWRA